MSVGVTHDVIVVGLGGVGSAVAAELARRGQRVLGLDPHPPAHDRGSSHGQTRIVRRAYFEGATYLPLLLRAYELWLESGLLTRTGALFLGAPDSRVVEGSRSSAARYDLPHEVLDAAEITRRYPAMTPPPGTVGVLDPDAGVVGPEAAVTRQLTRAAQAGAELRHGEAALSWTGTGDGVRVRTPLGTHEAGALVLAPGPWAPELLGDLDLPLTVSPRVQHWFDPPGGAAPYAPGAFPAWIWERADGTVTYGLPAVAGPEGGVKTAMHHSRVRAPADWTVAQLAAEVAPLLPGLGAVVQRSVPCAYTLTPDEHLVVGRHPVSERVVLACGLSGHGFKLTPVLAEVLADLVLDGRTAYDLAAVDPLRFA